MLLQYTGRAMDASWDEHYADEKDAASAFKSGASSSQLGEVNIPINAFTEQLNTAAEPE